MEDQMESQEASVSGSPARQKASVARLQCGRMAASKSSSCGVISAKPSSHKFWIWSSGVRGLGTFAQGLGGRVKEAVAVLQFVSVEPARIGIQQQRQVMEFVLKFAAQAGLPRQRVKFGGRELMLLQFAEQLAELPGETGTAGAVAE